MKLRPTGVTSDGTRHWDISGLPGGPKDILGIKKRVGILSMTGSGRPFISPRPAKLGEAVTVETDAGVIRIRIAKVRDDGWMMGTVELFNTPSGTALDIHGIRHKDSVLVPGMDFVQIVHTD
ncbi:MAG TPA: hypothetical protein VN929_17095 [Burkholderiales bacterium]|nr:hypothetical protein [Burkholderiales bacterium]